MKKMKLPIGRKLMLSGVVVIFVILLMVVANQVVVNIFKDTSTKLVEEYNELGVIEDLKFSLTDLLISTSSYAIYKNSYDKDYFGILIYQSRSKLTTSNETLTHRHNKYVLQELGVIIDNVDSLAKEMFKLPYNADQSNFNSFLKEINSQIDMGIIKIDKLLDQTMTEIDDYVEVNKTVIKHSTITYLFLGFSLILALIINGWLFIRSITKPIYELVSTTDKISRGKISAKVKIDSQDEFQTLAESFNKMMNTLEETTVSRNYFDNILKNMFDTLIVTENLKIRSVNKSAIQVLGYEKSELIGHHVLQLFSTKNSMSNYEGMLLKDMKSVKDIINNQKFLVTKSSEKIPTLISCTFMKDQKNNKEGLIIVGHDLREKMAIEGKLENERKERLVAINEAQEVERIRIATDLHDGLGQMLTAISYAVEDLKAKSQSEDKSIHKIQIQIDRAIREAKNIAHNLIPIVLKDFGLIVALQNLIDKANQLYSTKFRFDAFDFNERIDPKREKVLYRICQESLNNIVKHAKAKNADYQIFWQDSSVVLVIEDDGIGFDTDTKEVDLNNTGIGLISMRERVLAFEGEFTINSKPGEGTEIIVEIPCQKNLVYGNS